MGHHKFLLGVVAILVTVSASANLLGTYMLKPVINRYIVCLLYTSINLRQPF